MSRASDRVAARARRVEPPPAPVPGARRSWTRLEAAAILARRFARAARDADPGLESGHRLESGAGGEL